MPMNSINHETGALLTHLAYHYLLLFFFFQFDHGLDRVPGVQEHSPVSNVRQELVGKAYDVAAEQHYGVGY